MISWIYGRFVEQNDLINLLLGCRAEGFYKFMTCLLGAEGFHKIMTCLLGAEGFHKFRTV